MPDQLELVSAQPRLDTRSELALPVNLAPYVSAYLLDRKQPDLRAIAAVTDGTLQEVGDRV